MGLFDFLKKKEFEEIQKLKLQLDRYKPIADIEVETENQKRSLEQLKSLKQSEVKNVEENYNKLNADYQSALEPILNFVKKLVYSRTNLILLNLVFMNLFTTSTSQMNTELNKTE